MSRRAGLPAPAGCGARIQGAWNGAGRGLLKQAHQPIVVLLRSGYIGSAESKESCGDPRKDAFWDSHKAETSRMRPKARRNGTLPTRRPDNMRRITTGEF